MANKKLIPAALEKQDSNGDGGRELVQTIALSFGIKIDDLAAKAIYNHVRHYICKDCPLYKEHGD